MEHPKTTKLFKPLVTLALAAVMAIGTGLPAFAAGPITGTETDPAVAALTKTLKMPEGTTTPTTTFQFEFAKKEFNQSDDEDELAKMPDIGTDLGGAAHAITLSYTNADEGTVDSGTKTVSKQFGDILSGVTFTTAGIYTYTITETQDTYDAETNETMTYSQGKYDITFFVQNKSDNSGVFVASIATVITALDPGNDGDIGDKVDPTPGENETDFSKLVFTNVYVKQYDGVDPETAADQALSVSKTVTGAMGSQTLYFDYSFTVEQPALVTGTVNYKAYILQNGTAIVPATDNTAATILTDGNGKSYFEIEAGTTTTVHLKHGQRLVITDLHIGARYEALEAGALGYTPSVEIVVNNGTAINQTAAAGAALSTNDEDTGRRLIGEAKNTADFTNHRADITPTGVIIENLPFVALLLVAIGSLIVFVVVKSRKRRGYSAR